MRLLILLLVLPSVAMCLPPKHIDAAAVYLKGVEEPVLGFIKSRTATHVNIIVSENGENTERLIPNDQIEEVLETVVAERLASLDPSRLSEYRDYAEELMVKRADPEARQAAIRLFLITANLGDGNLRNSALRGLVSLARTGEERRRFLALAYRFGAISLPGKSASSQGSSDKIQLSEQQQAELIGLIHSSRAEVSRRVRTQAAAEKIKTVFDENDLGMTHQTFFELISKSDRSASDMSQIVELELRILGQFEAEAAADQSTSNWADEAAAGTAPVASLDFANATEFNPNACLFVEGRWTESR